MAWFRCSQDHDHCHMIGQAVYFGQGNPEGFEAAASAGAGMARDGSAVGDGLLGVGTAPWTLAVSVEWIGFRQPMEAHTCDHNVLHLYNREESA